jgi:hypothetical protein
MKKSIVGILAAVAVVAVADTAAAQICAGFPASERGFYFGGRADFPQGENTSLGVEAAYNASGPLSVYGGLNVRSHDEGTETHTLNEFRAGAAFELASLGAMIGPRVSTCPFVETRWMSEEGLTAMEIPLGLGLGVDLGMPAGPSIGAYVQPQIVFFRLSGDGFDTMTENNFGLTGGAMVGFGQVTVGGELRHIFADERDPTFGIRVGIRL